MCVYIYLFRVLLWNENILEVLIFCVFSLQIDFWIFFFFLNLNFLPMLFRNFERKIGLRRAVILMLFSVCSFWRYLSFNSNQILRDMKPKVWNFFILHDNSGMRFHAVMDCGGRTDLMIRYIFFLMYNIRENIKYRTLWCPIHIENL